MEPDAVYCPDCETWVPQDEFVAHREQEHVGEPKTLVASGIRTEEAVNGQTREE